MQVKTFDLEVEKFIASLQEITITKTLRTIDLLGNLGYQIGMPHSKKISGQLFELRIPGRQEVRLFYTFHNKSVILLHGFIKKSQKTPAKELAKAMSKIRMLDRT